MPKKFLLAMIALFACGLAHGQDKEKPKEVKILQEWKGTDSRILNEEFHRITTQKDWVVLWKRRTGKDEKPPEVNFEKEMVVGIFLGRAGSDFTRVGHMKVSEKNDSIVVEYSYFPEDFTTSVVKSHYGIVRMPRSSKVTKILFRIGSLLGEATKVVHEFPALKDEREEGDHPEDKEATLVLEGTVDKIQDLRPRELYPNYFAVVAVSKVRKGSAEEGKNLRIVSGDIDSLKTGQKGIFYLKESGAGWPDGSKDYALLRFQDDPDKKD